MSRFLKSIKRFLTGRSSHHDEADLTAQNFNGKGPDSVDTVAAIQELSRAVKNNPDSVEIYLALGNLFRSQGEIERAVQIRNSLIVRPYLDNELKSKAWYELGRDYKRSGFMDRASEAFKRASELSKNNIAINLELAKITAESGDFERAAAYYGKLGHPKAQAHFIVRSAELAFAENNDQLGNKLLSKSLKIHPGSIEAWLTKLRRAYIAGDWKRLGRVLEDAFQAVNNELRFLLMEELTASINAEFTDTDAKNQGTTRKASQLCPAFMTRILPILDTNPPDLLLMYYGGKLLIQCDQKDEARNRLEKAVMLNAEFWPARLELLSLALEENILSPLLRKQLEFFIHQTRMIKRFLCRACGLKRETVFFNCPKCGSWHSIGFRRGLHE